MKKNFFFVFKLIILILIILWLIKTVDLNNSFRVLSKTNLFLFFLALALNNLSNVFLTIKWHRLAKPLGIKSKLIDLLKLNYVSIFYSMVIPGQASGEIVKGIKLAKQESSQEKVWVPIFIDKITNLLIILIIGSLAIINDNAFNKDQNLVIFISLFTFALFIFSILLFTDKIKTLFDFIKGCLVQVLNILKINSDTLNNFSLSYLKEYKNKNLIIAETFMWSILTKLPHVFALYLLAMSLDFKITIIESAWLFAIVSIASILPISFSGLGVREGTLIVLMSKIGIESSDALSFSILIFAMGILTGLIGGVIEFYTWFKPKKC